jgi:hypothetical protein
MAQLVADGACCTVYGSKGYMTDGTSYAQGNEECTKDRDMPGSEDAQGRCVWAPFQSRGEVIPQREFRVSARRSVTVDARSRTPSELAQFLEEIMKSGTIEFPPYKLAPDITINYIHGDQVHVLDVYANGKMIRDRISKATWSVPKRAEFVAQILRILK